MTSRLWWLRPENFRASPAALALLNPEERQRQQRFIPPAKQHEYLLTRILVRSVLGDMLGCAPATLEFVHNEWGCPSLAPGSTPRPIHFNISHTEGLIVCAVSSEHQVGIDTECLSRAPTLLRLAPNVFARDELAALRALPESEQAQRAVHLWTLKESYIKARGMGLALPLDAFAFDIRPDGIDLEIKPELDDDGANWLFQTQMLGSHMISTALRQSAQNGWPASAINTTEFDISAFQGMR